MTPTKKLLIGAAGAALLTLGAASYAAAPSSNGNAPGASSEEASGKMHRAHWRGRHGKRGHRYGHFCSDRQGKRFDRLTGVIEGLMTFTPAQDQAWKSLNATVQSERATIKKDCDELKDAGRPKTASQKLARMEKVLGTRLSSLQRVRPAFDKFYETLNDKQKSAIDGLFSRRGRK